MLAKRALLGAASLLVSLLSVAHAAPTPPEPVALWTDAGVRGITVADAGRLAHTLHRPVQGVYVPPAALGSDDLGNGSLLTLLAAGGLVGAQTPADLRSALARVPASTTLTMATSAVRHAPATSVGAPGANATTHGAPEGSDDCTDAPACAEITIAIELTGGGPKCLGPQGPFGICLFPWSIVPTFHYSTTQTVDITRTNEAIDSLSMSSMHFHDDDGNNWGANFVVNYTNPHEPGAGAHYLATSRGTLDMIEDVSIPPSITPNLKAVLSSGFCMEWTVEYPNYAPQRQTDGFQGNWELTAGVGTSGYMVDQAGFCSVS
jgi:hypothetical protein